MKWLKIGGVMVGAMIVTALGIDAADTLTGSSGTLLGQLAATDSSCPSGMIEVGAATTFKCVDIYEASADEDCPIQKPVNEFDTNRNLADANCTAISKADTTPWRYIKREDAQVACIRSGKRLPTNEEWQLFAAGTPDKRSDCNIFDGAVHQTGKNENCISAAGVYDAVGNVWEWTHDDVFDGNYNNRALPSEGYVNQVDKGGVATLTGTSSNEAFGKDYFWSKKTGAFAMMRGGYYGSRDDAGVYTTHAATPPNMVGEAIGFRCVL